MADRYDDFRAKLLGYFTGARAEIAERDMRRYLHGNFTGRWFEHFADPGHPNEFTERDLLAVQMLSVDIPPRAAIWILEDGAARLSEQLEQIPVDVPIWEADGEQFEAADRIWEMLNAQWTLEDIGANKVGTTKKSKLLAAKRPAMLPVIDRSIKRCLGPFDSYYDGFRHAFAEPEARLLMSVRTVAGGERVSLLRAADIVVWMADNWALEGDPPVEPYEL